ncbi:MAG: hypothetical protein JNM17_31710 [Archangium sp.]|nr:hypothetical protein [Archangium sp.]
MMLPTLVLVAALSAGGGDAPEQPSADQSTEAKEAKLTPAKPPALPNDDAVKFDELPDTSPRVGDDARVQRFLGAFAGGLVGLGATLALIPLADSASPCPTCLNGWHVVLGAAAPVVSLTAAWATFTLLGGDAGILTPVVAYIPAVLAGLLIANIAKELDANTVTAQLPFLAAAGFFLAGGAAIALDSRSRQLAGLGSGKTWGGADAGRVAVNTLVSATTTAVSALLSVLGGVLNPFFGIALGVLQSVGVAAATWGVHRSMKGKGTLGAALAGMGVGGAVTFAAVGLYALSQSSFSSFNALRSTSGGVLTVQLGIMAALFAPTLALEFSHSLEIEAAMPKFSVGAAPMRDGGMISAGMRF